MTSRRAALVIAALAVGSGPAVAHPHIWVTSKTEIRYDDSGRVAALRHAWTFDEGYTSFLVQGLDVDGDGVYSTQELTELAQINAESLVELDYYTFVKADGREQGFGAPRDYFLSHDGARATLTYTLPLAAPVSADTAFVLEIYDPTYFVAFRMDDGVDAVALAGGPEGCAVDITRPAESVPIAFQSMSEAMFEAMTAMDFEEAEIANRALVACP